MARKTIVPVRLTEGERFIYRDAAARLGMSISALMREGALALIHREIWTKDKGQGIGEAVVEDA